MRLVLLSLVQHLHNFIRDVELTADEWDDARSLLLSLGASDADEVAGLLESLFGISALIRSMDGAEDGARTARPSVPTLPLGANLSIGQPGEPLLFRGRVETENGAAVSGATVDVITSEPEYDLREYAEVARVRLRTNPEGRFDFWRVPPLAFSVADQGNGGRLLSALGLESFAVSRVTIEVNAPGFQQVDVVVDGSPLLPARAGNNGGDSSRENPMSATPDSKDWRLESGLVTIVLRSDHRA